MSYGKWVLVGAAFLVAGVVSARGAGIDNLGRSHGKSIRVGSAYTKSHRSGYTGSRYSTGGGYSSFGK